MVHHSTLRRIMDNLNEIKSQNRWLLIFSETSTSRRSTAADVVSTYTRTLVMLLLTRTLDFFQWLQRQPDEC